MKFQNPSMHGSAVMLFIKKHAMKKCPKLQRAIIHEVFFRIYSQVNQVIYSSIPIYLLGFKALASTLMEKKIHVSYFFMRNPYLKFQNPSSHGSEGMLCINTNVKL